MSKQDQDSISRDAFMRLNWMLAPASEAMLLPVHGLSPTDQATIDACIQKGYVTNPLSTAYFRFLPPKSLNAEQTSLWDAAFKDADHRLLRMLRPFVDLPWNISQITSDYYVWQSQLTPDQAVLIEEAPFFMIKHRNHGDILTELRKNDILYVLKSDRIDRLYRLVDQKFKEQLGRDVEVIASLPWAFESDGTLVLPAEVIAALPDQFALLPAVTNPPHNNTPVRQSGPNVTPPPGEKAKILDIIQHRGILLKDGSYRLRVPNTIYKLYDAPNGETDIARRTIYDGAHDVALQRNKPLMNLPWQYDHERGAFFVLED